MCDRHQRLRLRDRLRRRVPLDQRKRIPRHPQKGCMCEMHVRRRTKDREKPENRLRRKMYGRTYYKKNTSMMLWKGFRWRRAQRELARHKSHDSHFKVNV